MKSVARIMFAALLSMLVALHGSIARADDVGSPRVASHDVPELADGQATFRAPPLPGDYVVVRRGSLEIAYPPSLEEQVHQTLAHVDHDAHIVASQLGLSEYPRLEIRLVPDATVMTELAPRELPPPAYAVGVAYPSIGLALVAARAPQTWEATDIRRVLRHEISHLLLDVATGHARIPRWFSEGIAITQSGEHSLERMKDLGVAAVMGGLVPIRRLDAAFSGNSDDVNIAYAESADVVTFFMRTEGEPRFAILLSHLRTGLSIDEACRQTYGGSLAQLEFEWRHDLESRFWTAPLWAGTGALWVLAVGLLIAAYFRQKMRSKRTIQRWEREEVVPDAGFHVTVVTPGAQIVVPSVSFGLEPIAETFAAPAETKIQAPQDDPPRTKELPEIVLDGERFTLH